MLWRLSYSMWVSLGHRPTTPQERAADTAYVIGALPKIIRRVAEVDELVALVGL